MLVKALLVASLLVAFQITRSASLKLPCCWLPAVSLRSLLLVWLWWVALFLGDCNCGVRGYHAVDAAHSSWDIIGRAIAGHLQVNEPLSPELLVTPEAEVPARAIIIGYGRVGRLLSDMLDEHGVSHIAIEHDPANVAPWRYRGKPVYYGDARNDELLRQSGIRHAEAVLITINSPSIAEDIVRHVRGLNQDVVLVARARDAEHARRLYDLGATEAVPETIEASLQLAEASLLGLGIPTGPVIASIHGKRDELRDELQGVGGYAGQAGRGSARSRQNPT